MRGKIEMVGTRYGRLVVLADAPWRRNWQRMVRVRCACGREYLAQAQALRNGRTKRCAACRDLENGRKAHAQSVLLPDGRTIARVAKEAGLKLDTVYRRWLRGWPIEKLGTPRVYGRGQKRENLGGSADLPERRCTVYPERRA